MSDAPTDSDISSAVSSEERDGGLDAITKLTVEGFKSLARETEIEIRPLTILAGANSSGKSSAMQPMLLLKQTLEAPFDPGPLLLNGTNVKFRSASEMLSNFPNSDGKLAEYLEISVSTGSQNVKVRFGDSSNGIRILSTTYDYEVKDDSYHVSLRPGMSISRFKAESRSRTLKHPKTQIRSFVVRRDRCFLKYLISTKRITDARSEILVSDSERPSDSHVPNECIEGAIHVPGLRDNPSRTYKTTAVGNRFPGTFDDYVASVIQGWQRDGDERLDRLVAQLQHMGLTRDVSAKQINDTQVELRVSQGPAGPSSSATASGDAPMINVADVGIGVSQVLPVLVAMLTAEPGQLVYIEQPEIHLHPRAQARLADAIVEASNRGVRVVVETHSQLLLLAVQTQIAEDQIDPEDVMLHWFTRGDDGITTVSSREPDTKGAFGDWPEDFSDVERHLENRYLDAAEKHLFQSADSS